MNSGALVVLTTVANAADAEMLARKIVESKLAACVQLLPPIKSVYVWEEAIQTESETLLLIKTIPDKYDKLERFIQTNHGYEVPEIVALQVKEISDGYFKWLSDYLN